MLWAQVDRRDDRVQLIVDDVALIDDLRLVMVKLNQQQAGDITVQHQLRECLQLYRVDTESAGERTPVVAEIQSSDGHCFVRLGHQFCVSDADAAAASLSAAAFQVSLRHCATA